MTREEIWYLLYDKGIHSGTDNLNEQQKDLFYFVDFIYQVEMDGSAGFLYNQSPTCANENFYAPYITSWKLFCITTLVEEVEYYNNQFLQVLELHGKNEGKDFAQLSKENRLTEIQQSVCETIDAVYENYGIVWDWIDQHKDKLLENLPG